MSCYIVRKDCIDKIASATKVLLEDKYNTIPEETMQVFNKCMEPDGEHYSAHKLYRLYYINNCLAYNGRYSGENVKEFPKFTGEIPGPFLDYQEVANLFGTYNYQISEDPVYGTPFYKASIQMEKEFAYFAIRDYGPSNR